MTPNTQNSCRRFGLGKPSRAQFGQADLTTLHNILFVFLGLLVSFSASATPQAVRVDGSIFDAAGSPVTANRDIQIKAYDAPTGGNLLWTSDTYNAAVSSGRFTINLDAASGSAPSLVSQIGSRTSAESIYFQVEVDSGAANGSMDSAQIVRPRIRAKGTMFALSAAKADSLSGVTATIAEMNRLAGVTTNLQSQINTLSSAVSVDNAIARGRLTPSSGTPVPTSDVLAATSIYYTPYTGNRIAIYDGSQWNMYSFTEISLSLSGYVANKNYDIFVYNNSGTLTLESTVWTNNTTRATALTMQDGVWVRSGGAGHNNRRFLGTIRTTGTTGQTELSAKKNFVSNVTNQLLGTLQASTTNTYSYGGATREAEGVSTYGTSRVGIVLCLPQVVNAWNSASGYQDGSTAYMGSIGIGLDSTSTMSGVAQGFYTRYAYDGWASTAMYSEIVSAGFHYLTRLERMDAGSFTFGVVGTSPATGYGGMKVNISY